MPVAEPGEGLILDQTEAPKKLFFETAPPPLPPPPPPPPPRLSQGLDDRPGYATEDGFGEWSQ